MASRFEHIGSKGTRNVFNGSWKQIFMTSINSINYKKFNRKPRDVRVVIIFNVSSVKIRVGNTK